jgi:hypothetical protein
MPLPKVAEVGRAIDTEEDGGAAAETTASRMVWRQRATAAVSTLVGSEGDAIAEEAVAELEAAEDEDEDEDEERAEVALASATDMAAYDELDTTPAPAESAAAALLLRAGIEPVL